MNLRPLRDRLVVRRVAAQDRSAGGILIPGSAAEKPVEGEVIAVGKGRLLDTGHVRPLDIKVGDRVLFAKYGGTDVRLDGEDLLMLREDDVMAVFA